MKHTRVALLRSFVFAVLVAGVAVFAISRGAEPTTTATLAILVVALFGGVEIREVVALRRALLGRAGDGGGSGDRTDDNE